MTSRGLLFAEKHVHCRCLRKLVKSILPYSMEKQISLCILVGLEEGEKLYRLLSCKLNNDFYDVSCKFRESIFGHQCTVEWYFYLLKLFCVMSLMEAVHDVK